jgi:hypothetical protein
MTMLRRPFRYRSGLVPNPGDLVRLSAAAADGASRFGPRALDRRVRPSARVVGNKDRADRKICCYAVHGSGELLRDWSELRPAHKKGPGERAGAPLCLHLSNQKKRGPTELRDRLRERGHEQRYDPRHGIVSACLAHLSGTRDHPSWQQQLWSEAKSFLGLASGPCGILPRCDRWPLESLSRSSCSSALCVRYSRRSTIGITRFKPGTIPSMLSSFLRCVWDSRIPLRASSLRPP